jgi:hypothetical protein
LSEALVSAEKKGKRWTWTNKGLPLHSGINVSCPKFLYVFSHCLWSYLTFLLGNEVKGPNSSSVLVLNAKGGEIKAKAIGSANHLWISKFSVRILGVWSKPSYCKNNSLVGEKFNYGKKGSF